MNFLKRLTSLFSAPSTEPSRYYLVYVQCNRCGEKIRGQIDMLNDLSIDYGIGEGDEKGGGQVTYFVRKGLVGEERCFQSVEVELTFDKDRRLIDRQIQGGKFLEEEESQSH
jgi:hypothetical protein